MLATANHATIRRGLQHGTVAPADAAGTGLRRKAHPSSAAQLKVDGFHAKSYLSAMSTSMQSFIMPEPTWLQSL